MKLIPARLAVALLLVCLLASQAAPLAALPALAPLDDIRLRFGGYIRSLDADSWRVGDVSVRVDADTVINQDGGKAEVGAWAVVSALYGGDGALRADRIDIVYPAGQVWGIEFSGTLKKQTDPYWVVGDTLFMVDEATRIAGEPVVGSLLKVSGEQQGPQLHAAIIEVIADDPGAVPVEFVGRLERIAGDLWTVDGSPVTVPPETVTGAPAEGKTVEVQAILRDGAPLLARKVLVQEDPPPQSLGGLVLGIGPEDAGEQTWDVLVFPDTPLGQPVATRVRLDAHTFIDDSRALARAGQWVDLAARPAADGSYRADSVRLEQPVRVTIKGRVRAVQAASDGGWWQVDGRPVWVRAENAVLSAARPEAGSSVDGLLLGNGVIWADRLSVVAPDAR